MLHTYIIVSSVCGLRLLFVLGFQGRFQDGLSHREGLVPRQQPPALVSATAPASASVIYQVVTVPDQVCSPGINILLLFFL